jgi:hypothetical protein
MLVPAPIADDDVPVGLEAAQVALRELDRAATARAGLRSLIRSLMATECLPGRDIMTLAAGSGLRPSVDIDRAVRRFERA